MPALVPELVHAAMEPSTSPSDVLRQALVVARRLAVPELTDWISSELNGYDPKEVPDYRRVRGELIVVTEDGIEPLFIPSAALTEVLSNQIVDVPVFDLQMHVQNIEKPFCIPSPLSIRDPLLVIAGRQKKGHSAIMVSAVQIQGILEKVKTRVLEWALDLEAKGVLGEGMTFTPQEKQTVQEQHYHFGDVSGSQIQIGSNGSHQTQTQTGGDTAALSALIEVLREVIQQGRLEAEAREELQAELATLQAQAASPKPKRAIIKATAGSIKAVLENAAGGVLSAKVQPYLTALL